MFTKIHQLDPVYRIIENTFSETFTIQKYCVRFLDGCEDLGWHAITAPTNKYVTAFEYYTQYLKD